MKLLTLAAICMMTVLVACASAPKDWQGMSEREVSAWKQLELAAESAQQWKAAGFSAETASVWLKNEFDLDSALEWSNEKFSAEEAKAWQVGGFDLKKAVDNRDKGLTPIEEQEAPLDEMPTAEVTLCKDPRPEMCTMDYRPVCGTDAEGNNVVYSNGCSACANQAVVSWVDGECAQ